MTAIDFSALPQKNSGGRPRPARDITVSIVAVFVLVISTQLNLPIIIPLIICVISTVIIYALVWRLIKRHLQYKADTQNHVRDFALANGWQYEIPDDYIPYPTPNRELPPELLPYAKTALYPLYEISGEIDGRSLRLHSFQCIQSGVGNSPVGQPTIRFGTVLWIEGTPPEKVMVNYTASTRKEMRDLFKNAGLLE